jgi:hypothetical protein
MRNWKAEAVRTLVGLAGIVWLSWTLAFIIVGAMSGTFSPPRPSLGEILGNYATSFQFLAKPGLEIATLTQGVAVVIGLALTPLWWGWRGRRSRGRPNQHHDLPPNATNEVWRKGQIPHTAVAVQAAASGVVRR